MSTDVSGVDQRQLVSELAQELGIDDTSAEACLIAADYDMEAAREVASLNSVDHLLLKCRFTGKNPIPHGGVFAVLFARGKAEPDYILGQTFDGLEVVDEMSPHFSTLEFMKAILNTPKRQRDVSAWHLLKTALEKTVEGISLDGIVFGAEGEDPVEDDTVEESEGMINVHSPLKQRMWELFKPTLDDYFTENVKFEIVPEYLSGFQIENLNELLEISDPKKKHQKEQEKKEESLDEKHETFRLVLKGRLIIDPREGVSVDSLEIGDTLVCDIVDGSPVAIEAGKMLGVYRKGLWYPVRGRIESIEENTSGSGTKRIRMSVGGGVYIESSALSAVKVRVSENELVGIMRRIESESDDSARSLLNMLPVALVILGVALALTILLQRG